MLHVLPDQSDEEDMPLQKDESWNPKIKMGNLGPKMARPVSFYLLLKIICPIDILIFFIFKVRDSAKNIAIEKGLEHAAHKTGGNYLKLKSSSSSRVVKARPVQPLVAAAYRVEVDFSKDRHRPKKVQTLNHCHLVHHCT